MKHRLKYPQPWIHLWFILTIMGWGAVAYYADQIPALRDVLTGMPINIARYSTFRILSIIPVAYAAFVFRLRGGVIIAIFVGLALLPRALLISQQRLEAVSEIVAFLFIGLLISWLIDRQQRTVHRLENAQQEIKGSLQTIENQQQQLTSLYAISTTVYQTHDVNQVAGNALDKVLDATGAKIGWIYLLDEETGDLVLTAYRHLAPQFISDSKRVRPGEKPDGQVFQSSEPMIIETPPLELSFKLSGQENIGALAVVPLHISTGTNGTLGIVTGEQRCSSEKLELLTTLSNEVGIVIHHARLAQKESSITQQLRLSEERYRGLFENASEAILVCSTVGRIISVNKACEQLTGYTQNELSTTTIYERFSGINLDKVTQLLSRELEGITVGEAEELRLVRKDGTEAFIQLRASPLLRGDEVIGLQAIARDVTEERQLQQNMEYYVTQITRAQENERLRISRELHDDTTQVLAALSREINSLLSKEEKLPKPTAENLEKLHEMADSALEGVRRFSQDLRPSILDDLGLVPALEWLSTDMYDEYGITTSVSIIGNQHRLPPEKELAIFRIAQEALSNVRRHSHASAVEMTVDFSADALTLVMSDNGQGFDMPARTSDLALSGKLGIMGMRERARLSGGTIIVQSEVGVGTTVTLRIPD
ncbi:PAS domain S-box protein [Chloroflexota bacterium]